MSGPCTRSSTSWGKGWGSHSDPPGPAMLGGARASQEWAGGLQSGREPGQGQPVSWAAWWPCYPPRIPGRAALSWGLD